MPKLSAVHCAWCLGVFFAGPAAAQSTAAQPIASAGGLQLEMGLTLYRETYEETGTSGQRIMREQAPMAGIEGRLTWPVHADWKARLIGEYARGQSDYIGANWGGSYGSVRGSGIDREKFSLQLDAVWAPAAWNGLVLSAGVMGRRLVDDLQQMPGGYHRVNTSYFAVLGVAHRWAIAPQWSLQPALQYQYLLDGKQTAATQGGLKFDQDSGYGWSVSATLAQARSDGSGLRFRPFWRQLNINASQPSRGFYEPKNKTQEWGLDVGWAF